MYQVERTIDTAVDEARKLAIVLDKSVLILKIPAGVDKGYGPGVGFEVATWDDYLIAGYDSKRLVETIRAGG